MGPAHKDGDQRQQKLGGAVHHRGRILQDTGVQHPGGPREVVPTGCQGGLWEAWKNSGLISNELKVPELGWQMVEGGIKGLRETGTP